jgi:hypothetical protein
MEWDRPAAPTTPIRRIAFTTPQSLPRKAVYFSGFDGELVSGLANDVGFKGVLASGGYEFVLGGTTPVDLGASVTYGKLRYGCSASTDVTGRVVECFENEESYTGVSLAAGVRWPNDVFIGIGGALKKWEGDFGGFGEIFDPGTVIEQEATAFDVGVRAAYARGDANAWSFTAAAGIAARNLGDDVPWPDGSSDPLPEATHYSLTFRADAPARPLLGTRIPVATVVINADVSDPDEGSYRVYGVGIEAAAYQIAFFRLGWRKVEHLNSALNIGAGVGVTTDRTMFRLDYSVAPVAILNDGPDLGSDNKFGFTVGLFL